MSRRILLVDDEKDITNSIKTGLERHGFVVEPYNDPSEALAHIRPDGYDLAVFDIRMPRMSGFELYRRFKKADGHTPVCFLTAFEIDASEFDKLFPDVPVTLLRKTITLSQLVRRLNEIIEGAESAKRRPVIVKS